MASKYTVATGDGYQGVWKARNHELTVNLATTDVEWPPGVTIFFARHADGIQATTSRPTGREIVATVDVTDNQRPVLRVPWAAVEVTGLKGGAGDVRAYSRDDADGLVLVAAANDPYINEGSADDDGADEVVTDGGTSIDESGRPGGAGECPQGCHHPVAGHDTLETREETVPVEPPNVFEVYGETVVQTERVRRFSKCIVCGWVIDL